MPLTITVYHCLKSDAVVNDDGKCDRFPVSVIFKHLQRPGTASLCTD
jgi:hypothetical protein